MILILYCEGLNLCHYRYGSNASSVDFYYRADLILVFVSLLDAELRLESYCTGQLALSSSHGGGVERAGEKCRDRDSLLLAHPPLHSCTLSTQIILAADGGSTAPLQWDGGGGKRSSLFTNWRFSPGAAAVRWDLSGGAW